MSSAKPWLPERVVSAEQARSLVAAAFPELQPVHVMPLGAGWDNTAHVVNGEWVFRFPRRTIAVPLLEMEIQALPGIAPRVPLAVPEPTATGAPTADYPWPFAGYRMLPGQPAHLAGLSDDDRERLAPVLGRFLRALHDIDSELLGLAHDPYGKARVAERFERLRQRLATAAHAGLIGDAQPWLHVMERDADVAPSSRAVTVHGDLDGRHLLVGDDHAITGVIDWGDVTAGDPALDIAGVVEFLPPTARAAFEAEYGVIDERTLALARLRAFEHASGVAMQALDAGDAVVQAEAASALRHALAWG